MHSRSEPRFVLLYYPYVVPCTQIIEHFAKPSYFERYTGTDAKCLEDHALTKRSVNLSAGSAQSDSASSTVCRILSSHVSTRALEAESRTPARTSFGGPHRSGAQCACTRPRQPRRTPTAGTKDSPAELVHEQRRALRAPALMPNYPPKKKTPSQPSRSFRGAREGVDAPGYSTTTSSRTVPSSSSTRSAFPIERFAGSWYSVLNVLSSTQVIFARSASMRGSAAAASMLGGRTVSGRTRRGEARGAGRTRTAR